MKNNTINTLPRMPITTRSLLLSRSEWPASTPVRLRALKLLHHTVGVLSSLGLEANELEIQEFLEWLPDSPNKPLLHAATLAYMRHMR